MTCQSSTDNDF